MNDKPVPMLKATAMRDGYLDHLDFQNFSEAAQSIQDLAIQSIKVHLSSDDILNLHGSPFELIPAPGDGKVIQVLSVVGSLVFGTVAYDTNVLLYVIDTNSGDILFEDTGTLLAATEDTVAQIPANINTNAGIIINPNGSVSITVPAGEAADGDGTLDIYLVYKIITL